MFQREVWCAIATVHSAWTSRATQTEMFQREVWCTTNGSLCLNLPRYTNGDVPARGLMYNQRFTLPEPPALHKRRCSSKRFDVQPTIHSAWTSRATQTEMFQREVWCTTNDSLCLNLPRYKNGDVPARGLMYNQRFTLPEPPALHKRRCSSERFDVQPTIHSAWTSRATQTETFQREVWWHVLRYATALGRGSVALDSWTNSDQFDEVEEGKKLIQGTTVLALLSWSFCFPCDFIAKTISSIGLTRELRSFGIRTCRPQFHFF